MASTAVLAVIGGALAFLHFHEQPPVERTLRYTIAAPENSTMEGFAISPDGKRVVIAAAVNGRRQLWLRALDSFQSQPVAGTEDARNPFWSPDSRYIGFFADGRLKKVAASGGPAQVVCDAPSGGGGSWNRDNVIVFSPVSLGGASGYPIRQVSAGGGVPADVTKAKGVSYWPTFLPDGRHFLYGVAQVTPDQNGIYMSSLDGKEDQRVLPDFSQVAFAAGRLLFVRGNALMAEPFDATSGRVVGEAYPVAEGASRLISVSETGVLLYDSADRGTTRQMAWYDRRGKPLGTLGEPGFVKQPVMSPDEKSVAFERNSRSGFDIWLRDLSRGAEQRLTTDSLSNEAPVWAPKGDRIAFASNRSGTFNLYQKSTSGTGQDELLLATGIATIPTQWSHDGRFIVYMSEFDPKTKRDIWVLPLDNGTERKPLAFVHSEFNELYGQLSPDIRWMAYTSDQYGRPEVYVRPFPGGEFQQRISIAGGEQPRWRGDGKELFFLGADGKIMSVAVKTVAGTKPSFEAGTPQPLFEPHMAPTSPMFGYDVTANGERFLVVTAGGISASAPLNVVVNWAAGLRK
jgi:Tol biopolymer transport system component